MNPKIPRLAALIALVMAAAPAVAQNAPPGAAQQGPGGVIQGAVRDDGGSPVGSASVAVYSAVDSALVTGALTRPDGAFRIEGLRPGRYYVTVTYMGHAPARRNDVAVTPAAPLANLGEIRLGAAAVRLDAIEVTAERSEVQAAPDRNTYSVRDMPAASSGSASDVLQNVPALEVDHDGKVSLRGNQNVVVQINGRAAPMRGEQLGLFLRQLPANMVERVEVVPNPSAKYDPEGMAGIVNIVLKQNTSLGLSGGFTASAGTGDRYNASGNLGWQDGPVTLFGSYGLFNDAREMHGFNLRRYKSGTVGSFDQDFVGDMGMRSHTFSGSAEYKLDPRSSLAASTMISRRDMDNLTTNVMLNRNPAGDPTGRFRTLQDMESGGTIFDQSLSYKRTVQPQRNDVTLEVRYNRANEGVNTFLGREPLTLSDGSPMADATQDAERYGMDVTIQQLTGQADLIRPLGAATRIDFGYKGTLRRLDSDTDAANRDPGTGGWTPNPGRTNAFDYKEQVNAVYGVLNHTIGRLALQGGARVEHTDTRFDLRTTGETFDNGGYWDLFPSALASYNLSDTRQVKASYSKRIQRPDSRLLNPFEVYETDDRNRFRGNPHLTPEYTHSFELGFQQSGRLGMVQATPFYRHSTDVVRRVKTLVGDTSIVSFANLASSNSYGADFNGNLRAGRVTGFAGINAFKVVTDGSNLEDDVSTDAFSWSARTSATVRLSRALDGQVFYMYRAPMDVEQGRISAFQMMHFALRHKVLNDKGAVTLRVVDPFDRMGFRFRTEDAIHYQESERRFGVRGVHLSFNYAFGRPPRIRTPQPQQQPDASPEIGIN